MAEAPSVEDSLAFEKLLADLSTTFINVPPEHVNGRIARAAGQLAEALGFDRTTIFRFAEDNERFDVVTSWAGAGIEAHQGTLDRQRMPWWTERMVEDGYFYMRTVDDLPPHAVNERAYVAEVGLKSLLGIAVQVSGKITGAVSFGAVYKPRVLSDDLVRRVRLVGDVFGNALERTDAEAKLRQAFMEIEALKDRLEAENIVLRAEVHDTHDFEEIIGESAALKRVFALIEGVSATDSTVLITGETGTGKELAARAIHRRSRRSSGPFIAVNCSALPASLIESELFGHEKGAFTGALSRKIGRFELADGGTIFLDEVGELSVELQPKLLRVLQEGELERLGGSHALKVNVRVIAATNRLLQAEVESGRFRDDLYYRLAVFPIHMPALRERPDDIPLLTWYIINRKQGSLGKQIGDIPPRLMDALVAYTWPGNVRELENVLERAMILSPGSVLQIEPSQLGAAPTVKAKSGNSLEDVDREHILRVLRRCGGKINGKGNAAELLGLNPSTLRFRMKKLGIARD